MKPDQTDAGGRRSSREAKRARQRREWLRLGVVLCLVPLLVSSGTAWAEEIDGGPGSSQGGEGGGSSADPETAPGNQPGGSASPDDDPALADQGSTPEGSEPPPANDAADGAQGEIGLGDLGGFTPFNAPGNSFCTAPGVFTLAMENNPYVRSLQLNGTGSDAQSGTLGYTGVDALAIGSDCAWAYAINQTDGNGFNLHRLGSASSTGTTVGWFSAGVTGFQQPTAGAIKRVGTSDLYYFGYYTYAGGTATFQLFAHNVTTSTFIGRVAQIAMPAAATSAGAGGDIAFDAQGNLVLLWSVSDARLLQSNRTPSVLARLSANDLPTTVPGSLARTATLLATVDTAQSSPWNGLAYDMGGELWLQRASTLLGVFGFTYLRRVNPATGALQGTEESKFGYTGTDLASYRETEPAAPTITVQKSVVGNRYAVGDQFALDVRQGATSLAARTTTGSGAGVDSPPTDAVSLTPGSQITIGETGAGSASLGDYTWGYSCAWSGGGALGDGAMALSGARAASAALTVPAGREGQNLACTIVNTPKAVPFTLQASVTSRFTPTDQFTLSVLPQGSSTPQAAATTTSTGVGPQTPVAGPTNVTSGAVYTIAQSAASGGLGNYNMSYSCTWANGDAFVGTAPLNYNAATGRASATLPPVPANRDGQALGCTIVNTAKSIDEVPPQMILRKNVISRVNSLEDQFELAIHNAGEQSAIAAAVTAGTAAGGPGALGIQDAYAGAITIDPGNTYAISEGAAGTADLSGYTANFECRWNDAGNTLLARGALSLGTNDRIQALLPAIPTGHNGQTLSCTISNQVKVAGGLNCSVDQVYALEHTGRTASGTQTFTNDMRRVDAGGLYTSSGDVRFPVGSGTRTTIAQRGWNALAINRDGSEAIAVQQQRAGDGNTTLRLSRWNVSGTPQMIENNALYTGTVDLPTDIIGGGIDPTNGDYYFGGYTSGAPSALRLFVVRSGQTANYEFVGEVSVTGSSGSGNGDLTFDASGNLYLVWSLNRTGNDPDHILSRLEASALDTLNGGSVTATQVTTWVNGQGISDTYNGVTFDGQGYLWATYSGGARRINPSTGVIVDSPVTRTNLVDMASCGLPPTMRLQKDVVGRYAAGNQFQLHIDTVGKNDVAPAATTEGNTTGVQPQNVGPAVVVVNNQYTIRETNSGSPTSSFANYVTSFECRWSDETGVWASGVLGTTVSNTTRSQTLPPIPAGKSGQQLVCTIANDPNLPASITARKTVVDPSGSNPVGAAGWSITATRLTHTNSANPQFSTTGTAITGSATRVTGAGGSVPTAWEVVFPNSTAVMALQMTETMQPGYELVPGTNTGGTITGSHCTITPAVGAAKTVLLTGVSTSIVGADRLTAGNRVECEFVNRQLPGTAAWQKVDAASPSAYLAGSEWLLTGTGVPANTVVADCAVTGPVLCPTGPYTDQDPLPGRFRLTGLAHGDYALVEARAPAGFIVSDVSHAFSIAPTALDHAFAAPFENERRGMPAIPLTGGLGADAYLIGGVALFGMGAVAGWLLWRRRKQEARA